MLAESHLQLLFSNKLKKINWRLWLSGRLYMALQQVVQCPVCTDISKCQCVVSSLYNLVVNGDHLCADRQCLQRIFFTSYFVLMIISLKRKTKQISLFGRFPFCLFFLSYFSYFSNFKHIWAWQIFNENLSAWIPVSDTFMQHPMEKK